MTQKWNKSQTPFSTLLGFFLCPPLLHHSTLLPLFPGLIFFTSPYSINPFPFLLLLFISSSCLLLPRLDYIFSCCFDCMLLSSYLLSFLLFSPLQNVLWYRRQPAIFTKSKVIRYCWKQEKKKSLVPVIENRNHSKSNESFSAFQFLKLIFLSYRLKGKHIIYAIP